MWAPHHCEWSYERVVQRSCEPIMPHKSKENVRFTKPMQQLYNNPSHEGELQYLGPPSCEGLLYSCCIDVVQESNP